MPSAWFISFCLAMPVLVLLLFLVIQWCVERVDDYFRKKYMNIVLKNIERLERLDRIQRLLVTDHD